MTAFADKSRENSASSPQGLCERPDVVKDDSYVSPELGSQANPIVIEDELASLGSASDRSNADGTGQLGSPADTEAMDTPEFWATVAGEYSTTPADEAEAVVSPSIRSTSRSPVHKGPISLHFSGQSSASHVTVDGEVSETGKSHHCALRRFSCERSPSPVLQKSSDLGVARHKNGTIAQADNQQSTGKVGVLQAEETTENADNSIQTDLSCCASGTGSSKRKLSREESVPPKQRQSERLAKKART